MPHRKARTVAEVAEGYEQPEWYRPSRDQLNAIEVGLTDKIQGPAPEDPRESYEDTVKRMGRVGARIARVNYCMELLIANRYDAETTPDELAAYYGVARATIVSDLSEASRNVMRMTLGDDQLRKKLHGILDAVINRGMELAHAPHVTPGTQIKAGDMIVNAINTLAGIQGVSKPLKIDMTHGVSLDQLDEMRRVAKANKAAAAAAAASIEASGVAVPELPENAQEK